MSTRRGFFGSLFSNINQTITSALGTLNLSARSIEQPIEEISVDDIELSPALPTTDEVDLPLV